MRMADEIGLLHHDLEDLSHNEDEVRRLSGAMMKQLVKVGLCLNLMLN